RANASRLLAHCGARRRGHPSRTWTGAYDPPAPRDPGAMPGPRIPCVGATITAGGRILLIRRGHEPEAGRWSLPGGRIEAGETDEQALVREVREETGLDVVPGPLIGAVDRPRPGGQVLVIRDYAATVAGGALAAGDDA